MENDIHERINPATPFMAALWLHFYIKFLYAMTKFFVSCILIALLSFAACLYLPWWSIAVVALLVSLSVPQKPVVSFITGFLALFILWSAFALLISTGNDHVLARKMALVIFKRDYPFVLIFISGFIGSLVAGFAAMTGSYARQRKVKRPLVASL